MRKSQDFNKKSLNYSGLNKTINSSIIGGEIDQSVINMRTLRMVDLDQQRRSVDQLSKHNGAMTFSARHPPASFN